MWRRILVVECCVLMEARNIVMYKKMCIMITVPFILVRDIAVKRRYLVSAYTQSSKKRRTKNSEINSIGVWFYINYCIKMPQCQECGYYMPGFGVESRERNGLIQCMDCYCFCRNTYWKKLSHCKRCPKRKTTGVCCCPREPF